MIKYVVELVKFILNILKCSKYTFLPWMLYKTFMTSFIHTVVCWDIFTQHIICYISILTLRIIVNPKNQEEYTNSE